MPPRPVKAAATTGPKAYSYIRFSTPEQALGDSKRRQVEEARAWATAHGLKLDEELADEGVSGFRGANTRDDSALGAFLKAVHMGDVPQGSVLIVESLDRLSRDRILAAQNVLTSLLLAGVRIVTLTDRREYSEETVNENPTDLLVSLLVLMRANEESETKSKRLRAAWEAKRRKAISSGARMTTVAPAWLEPDGSGFRINEERAAVVRRIFAATVDGRGQNSIAAELTAEGVSTWNGGTGWHRTYVRKIIDNRAVIGELVPHVTERKPGGGTVRKPVGDPVPSYYPAIIDPETWERARAAIGSRGVTGTAGRGRHGGKPIAHMLAGIARCPICEGTMTRVSKGPRGGRAMLVCAKAKRGHGCLYRAVPTCDVEAAIVRDRVRLLEFPPTADQSEAACREKLAEIETEISLLVDRRADFDETRRARRLTALEREAEAQTFADQQALEDRRRDLLDALAGGGSKVLAARVARVWDALEALPDDGNRTEANQAMREAFEGVTVDHRDESLTFRWRHGGESFLSYGTPDWG